MRFVIDGELFERLVAPAKRIAEAEGFYSTVMLEAGESGTVALETQNLEVGVRLLVEAQVLSAGRAVVPGRVLAQLVSLLSGAAKSTAVSIDGDTLELRAASLAYHLQISPEPWRDIEPSRRGVEEVCLPTTRLRSALALVQVAAARGKAASDRPGLAGVYVEVNGHTLTATATDGHRLGTRAVELHEASEPAPDGGWGCLVTLPACEELARLTEECNDGDGVALDRTDSQLVVAAVDGRWVIAAHLPHDPYPDWRKVIPPGGAAAMQVSRHALTGSLRAVQVLATEGMAVLHVAEGQIHIMAVRPTVGDAWTAVSLDDDVSIERIYGVSCKYLMDALTSVGGERVTLRSRDDLSPITVESEDTPGLLHLVMPIRVGREEMERAKDGAKGANGVAAAFQRFRDTLPEGTKVTLSGGNKSVTVEARPTRRPAYER